MDAAPTTAAHRNSSSYAAVLASSRSSFSRPSLSKGMCIGMEDCGLLGGSPGFLSLRESDDGRLKTKQVEYLLLPDDYMEDLDSPTTEGGETTEFGSSHDSADSCVDFSDPSVVDSARILRDSSEEHDDIFEDVSHLPDLVDLGNTEMLTPFATFSNDSSKSAMNNIIGGIGEEDEVNGSVLIQMVRSGYQAPVHVEPKASVTHQQQQQPSLVPRQGSNTVESTPAVANAAKAPKAQLGKAAASRAHSQPSTSPKRGGAGSSAGVSKPSIPRNRSKVQALPADASKSLALKAAAAAGMPCCRNCGTTNTPLWRGGPEGPKTLCNACGVRYMKTNKKPRERRA